MHGRGGERAVFERERNALAHQRFGARGIADQHDAGRRQGARPGVPTDREGAPAGRRRAAVEATSGDGSLQPSVQSRLDLRVGAGVRAQRVGSDVHVGRPADRTRKRPQIAAQAEPDRAEIEVGAPACEPVPHGIGRRHVAHQRLADGPRGRPDQGAADAAAGPVGADHDARPKARPLRHDTHGVRLADETHDLFVLADFGAAGGRGAEQQVVECVAAHDGAHVVVTDDRPVGRDVDAGALGPHVRDVEGDVKVAQAVERMRDQTAGADLVAGMHSLVQQQDASTQRGVGSQQVECGRGAGRTGAHDDDVVAVHTVRPGNAGFQPAEELTYDDVVTAVRLVPLALVRREHSPRGGVESRSVPAPRYSEAAASRRAKRGGPRCPESSPRCPACWRRA